MEFKDRTDFVNDILKLSSLQDKEELCLEIAEHLDELGYRKVPENPPPVLTMEQLTIIMKTSWANTVPLGETDLEKYTHLSIALAFEVAQAQRDADMEYYLGGSR